MAAGGLPTGVDASESLGLQRVNALRYAPYLEQVLAVTETRRSKPFPKEPRHPRARKKARTCVPEIPAALLPRNAHPLAASFCA